MHRQQYFRAAATILLDGGEGGSAEAVDGQFYDKDAGFHHRLYLVQVNKCRVTRLGWRDDRSTSLFFLYGKGFCLCETIPGQLRLFFIR